MKEFNGAITVCDLNGIVTGLNDKAAANYSGEGGYRLIGKNLFDCHSAESVEKIKEIIAGKKTNVYTVEKNGKKKIVYQSPWYEDGEVKGLVEISMEIPSDIPHFVRS
jgi:transcriptional regulator with PAS, ATPase and Fis domain